MPITSSSPATCLWNALLLDPADGKREWLKWRAEIDLQSLDDECLVTIPLLFGRLSEWFSRDATVDQNRQEDPGRNTILGICKRGWAQNQLRYRELAHAWRVLQRGGVEPIAIVGCAAWALLYWEERSVRPISCIDIQIPREQVAIGMQVLRSAQWIPDLDNSVPEERLPELLDRLWFRSPSRTFLSLRWRPRTVSPEMAAENETVPPCREFDLLGTPSAVLPTEELFLDALTRTSDDLVGWKCDAAVLRRNRNVDWQRFGDISRNFPLAAERLSQIQKEGGALLSPR